MTEPRPFALGRQAVQDLLATGRAQVVKSLRPQPLPSELPAKVPYAAGERFWGRESVAAHQGQYLYDADGRQPGLYYQKCYHMPRAACRLELVATAVRLEQLEGEWVAVVDLRQVEAHAGPVFALDFDQVAQAGHRTRHRPSFAVATLAVATDAAAATSAFVRAHARYHHDAWWLPLVKREVRHWLKALRFTQPPSVQVGGVDVVCGKEAPG